MRDGDETRDAERNRQMPEQPRIQRILNLKQRADKNGYAQEPSDAANRRCKPGQMNQSPARLRELLQRRSLIAGFRLKETKQIPERKNPLEPQIHADGVNNSVVND